MKKGKSRRTSPNIIIKKPEPWRGHQMATDGKQGGDEIAIERKENEKKFINEQYNSLRAKGYKCEVKHDEKISNAKPAIVGMFNGNPFVVYINWIMKGREWCAIVTTRYKGADRDMKPPHEILK